MRNFDEERAERFSRERTFQIGGEIFTFQIGLRPEDYAAKIESYTSLLTRETRGEESIAIMDESIKAFLDSDADRGRWENLRERETEPVTAYDMAQVMTHIIQEQMGSRPTAAPSSTGNGREPTGTTSTESSSSEVEGRVVSEA